MILGTSAVVSVLREEQGSDRLEGTIERALSLAIGAPTLLETAIVLMARMTTGREIVDRFVRERDVEVSPFDDLHRREAATAFERFGKGRHRAALNLGDCMTYATARLAGEPLLCVGDDFALTDLDLA